jgi:hypothetical protein
VLNLPSRKEFGNVLTRLPDNEKVDFWMTDKCELVLHGYEQLYDSRGELLWAFDETTPAQREDGEAVWRVRFSRRDGKGYEKGGDEVGVFRKKNEDKALWFQWNGKFREEGVRLRYCLLELIATDHHGNNESRFHQLTEVDRADRLTMSFDHADHKMPIVWKEWEDEDDKKAVPPNWKLEIEILGHSTKDPLVFKVGDSQSLRLVDAPSSKADAPNSDAGSANVMAKFTLEDKDEQSKNRLVLRSQVSAKHVGPAYSNAAVDADERAAGNHLSTTQSGKTRKEQKAEAKANALKIPITNGKAHVGVYDYGPQVLMSCTRKMAEWFKTQLDSVKNDSVARHDQQVKSAEDDLKRAEEIREAHKSASNKQIEAAVTEAGNKLKAAVENRTKFPRANEIAKTYSPWWQSVLGTFDKIQRGRVDFEIFTTIEIKVDGAPSKVEEKIVILSSKKNPVDQ